MDRFSTSAILFSFASTSLAFPKIDYLPVHAGITLRVDAENIAWEYITKHQQQLNIQFDLQELSLLNQQKSLLGDHFTYQRMVNHIPVKDQTIHVTVNHGQVSKIVYEITPISTSMHLNIVMNMDEKQALAIAWEDLAVAGTLNEAPSIHKQYIINQQQLMLVYEIELNVTEPHGIWHYTIDATTGHIVSVENHLLPRNNHGIFTTVPRYQRTTVSLNQALEELKTSTRKQDLAEPYEQSQYVAGSATVFDTNPMVDLADETLTDQNDEADFTNAYIQHELPEISYNKNHYSLDGPFVKIMDFDPPKNIPTTSDDGQWNYHRGDNGFYDANAFYHIDHNQRYLRSLGYVDDKAIQNKAIGVDTNGCYGEDNSYYLPSQNRIAYGHGGVPDAEDSDVILHEYGHAIEHDINPDWRGGDTGAMGEGFGDYWATTYRHTFSNGTQIHPEWVFLWDGHNDYWSGRVLDATELIYDKKKTYYAHMSLGNKRSSDELWSTPLYQAAETLIAQGVSRSEIDTIIIEAHFGLGSNIKMPQMAQSIIDTAEHLYPNGPHANVFREKFIQQNIIQDQGPIV